MGKDTLTLSKTDNGSKVELVTDQSIETPATTEFGREMREEAFMNEYVTVQLADTTDDNAPPHIILSVNGTTQPLMRGVPVQIRRKYLEVLARCKETKYSQRVANPNEPDRIEMVQRTALAYPYQVLEDSAKGMAWHKAVLAEAA